MNRKNFLMMALLTVMDIVVFILCVDKGLTPVTIVGACYMALRCFSRDAQNAIDASDDFVTSVVDRFKNWRQRLKEKKEESLEVVETETEN